MLLAATPPGFTRLTSATSPRLLSPQTVTVTIGLPPAGLVTFKLARHRHDQASLVARAPWPARAMARLQKFTLSNLNLTRVVARLHLFRRPDRSAGRTAASLFKFLLLQLELP